MWLRWMLCRCALWHVIRWMQGRVDGRLEGLPAGMKGDAADGSMFRSEARDLLAQASVDGRIECVLASAKCDAAPQLDVAAPDHAAALQGE